MRRSLISAFLLAAALPACAPTADSGNGVVVAAVTPRFKELSSWLVQTTEQVPDSLYGYKPNPAVRTMAEIMGHVANSHYLFCSAALGESEPAHPDYTTVTTKDSLVAGMRESVAYCERAYQLSDAEALEATQFFGETRTRLEVLIWNATHDGEHYGNLVVYMRANGMVPPSSQTKN
jgi:uncharacterized damage-inducible protein DinB